MPAGGQPPASRLLFNASYPSSQLRSVASGIAPELTIATAMHVLYAPNSAVSIHPGRLTIMELI